MTQLASSVFVHVASSQCSPASSAHLRHEPLPEEGQCPYSHVSQTAFDTVVQDRSIGCSPRNGNLAIMKKSSRTFTAYLLPNTSSLEEMFPNFLMSEFTSTILLQIVQVTLLQKRIIRCSIITNNIVGVVEAIKIDTYKVRPVLETLGSSL